MTPPSSSASCEPAEDATAEARLLPVYRVGCFTCSHTVREFSPMTAHDVMEKHYTDKHGALIAALAGDLNPTSPARKYR